MKRALQVTSRQQTKKSERKRVLDVQAVEQKDHGRHKVQPLYLLGRRRPSSRSRMDEIAPNQSVVVDPRYEDYENGDAGRETAKKDLSGVIAGTNNDSDATERHGGANDTTTTLKEEALTHSSKDSTTGGTSNVSEENPALVEREDEDSNDDKAAASSIDDGTNSKGTNQDLDSRSSGGAGMDESGNSLDISDDLIVNGTVKIDKLVQSDAATAVNPRRKEELLLEARNERLKWVQQVPLPYEKDVDDASLSPFLTYSHASQHLPAATKILQHLYGHAGSERIDTLLQDSKSGGSAPPDQNLVYLTGNQILAAELEAVTNEDTRALLKAYQTFLNHLQDPACGLLVQGMRNFCRTFRDIADAETAASRLKAYVAETFKTAQQQSVLKQDKDQLRRSFESFLFGHCRSHLDQLYWQTGPSMAKDKAFQERLQMLQFITPAHLDIACLAHNHDSLEELLSEAVAALRAVDSYHSVYEKLQQILGIYRGVNAALTAALNKDSSEGDSSGGNNQKLPSADDILPSIILTVLVARPSRLFLNLQLVEDMSPAEYLRGEAGYAFTNLFGAVQFLQDLDLDKEPTSLSISKEALQQGIASSKASVAERLQALKKESEILPSLSTVVLDDEHADDVRLPPLCEIRRARLGGEKVDVEWALQWRQHNTDAEGASTDMPRPSESALQQQKDTNEEERLPPGFRRHYSFLAKRPEDIRVSDLPLLLEEYRMLVRTTETLLGERAVKAAAARKAKTLAMEKELLKSVGLVDPSLLPEKPESKKKY